MPARPRKRVRKRRNTQQFDSSSSESDSSQTKQESNVNDRKLASKKSTGSQSDSTSKSNLSAQSSSESESDSETSSSSDQSSSSSSSGSSFNRPTAKRGRLARKKKKEEEQSKAAVDSNLTEGQECARVNVEKKRSPSPVSPQSPPPPISFFDQANLKEFDSIPEFKLPPILNEPYSNNTANSKDDLKTPLGRLEWARTILKDDEEKFKDWYMKTIVDRFPNELDELRSNHSNKKNNSKNSSDLDLLINSLSAGLDLFAPSAPTDPTGSSSNHHLGLDLNLVLHSIPVAPLTQTPSQPDTQMSS